MLVGRRGVVTSALTFDGRRGGSGGRRRSARLAIAVAVVAVVVAGVALTAPAAHAEDVRAAARRKLIEGTELLRAGDYPLALECFRAAHDLVPSSKIEYNLGVAYMRLARNADALAAFDTFLRETLDASPSSLKRARAYRDDLARKVARLVVRADVEGASIGIDGRLYGTTPRAEEILIDAGPHLLLVEDTGSEEVFNRTFVVPPGGSLTIEAKLLSEAPTVAPVVPLVAARPAPAADLPRWLKPTALAAGGLAVAALGLGTYEWFVKEQRYRTFNGEPCTRGLPDNGGRRCSQLLGDGDQAKRLGIIALSAGVALGAISTGLFVWSRHPTSTSASRETALACAPTLGVPGGACQLRF